jgi:hypothetical protein
MFSVRYDPVNSVANIFLKREEHRFFAKFNNSCNYSLPAGGHFRAEKRIN